MKTNYSAGFVLLGALVCAVSLNVLGEEPTPKPTPLAPRLHFTPSPSPSKDAGRSSMAIREKNALKVAAKPKRLPLSLEQKRILLQVPQGGRFPELIARSYKNGKWSLDVKYLPPNHTYGVGFFGGNLNDPVNSGSTLKSDSAGNAHFDADFNDTGSGFMFWLMGANPMVGLYELEGSELGVGPLSQTKMNVTKQ